MSPRCRNPMAQPHDAPTGPGGIGMRGAFGYCHKCLIAGVPELVEALRPFAEMFNAAGMTAHVSWQWSSFQAAAAIVARADANRKETGS